MTSFLFYLFAVGLLGASLFVVLNRNPMYSVVALVFGFANLAAIYFLLEAYFIGALQILVNAGAIMVLFLFVVMLLNVQADADRPGLSRAFRMNRWWIGVLALVFMGLFLMLVGRSTGAFLAPTEIVPTQIGSVSQVGEALFTRYLLPFELASLLLTVALIGTVFLAKRKI